MANVVVVSILKYFYILSRLNTFNHRLKVVLGQVNVAGLICWSTAHKFVEVFFEREFVDFIGVFLFELWVYSSEVSILCCY